MVVKEVRTNFHSADHYCYKALTSKWVSCLPMIGEVNSFKGFLLEADPIPESRAEGLKRGMILDLYPHLLLLVGLAFQTLDIQVDDLLVARYQGAPIDSETFAWVNFRVGQTRNHLTAGKAVGRSPIKLVMAVGDRGRLVARYDHGGYDQLFFFPCLGQSRILWQDRVGDGYQEFVAQMLQGRSFGLDLGFGMGVLAAVETIKAGVPAQELPSYNPSDSLGQILKKAGRLKAGVPVAKG